MGLSSSWVLSYLGRNLGCLAAALPPQLLLLGWLWSSRGQVGGVVAGAGPWQEGVTTLVPGARCRRPLSSASTY